MTHVPSDPTTASPLLLHAFSLDMLCAGPPMLVEASRIDALPRNVTYRSRIGQLVVASMVAEHLGHLEWTTELMNPGPVVLFPGDVAYVARYRGRFPKAGEDTVADGTLDFWYLRLTRA